jgi:hypothetical protein
MSPQSKALMACVGTLTAFSAFGVVAIRAVMSGGGESAAVIKPVADKEDALRQRGAYLWSTIGCADCHTPHDSKGEPIAAMTMAGHPADAPLPEWDPSMLQKNILVTIDPTFTAFAGPFGVSAAANITPDKETGIGNMTADDLIGSWRTGKHWKLPRNILPPMPVPFYANLVDDDIRALHAFLMTLPPIRNKVPDARPAAAPSDAPQGASADHGPASKTG